MKLNEEFIKQYEGKQPSWGPLGYVTYKRTYSRNGEEYWQTIRRVVEGTFNIQQNYCKKNHLPWKPSKAQRSAQKMFELMWDFKFTPPGRGLWMMGTQYVEERGGAALNNCAFVSTENLKYNFSEPFTFLMDMSMLGVGVGGDTKGAGTVKISTPTPSDKTHVVADTREGWTEVLKIILEAYAGKNKLPKSFDYSQVRPEGSAIKGFGGVASGPEPLQKMEGSIKAILDERIKKDGEGSTITSTDIVDIFNLVGKCVVSGNVRRSAEIMFGNPDDNDFLNLKNPDLNAEKLMNHRWASNNSIFAEVGMNYDIVASMTAKNGEPGYEWLSNARDFGRMGANWIEKYGADSEAKGGNPCLEQTLESYELCCLVETYPSRHDTLEEWEETLKYAYLYAKTVTLLKTHNARVNSVMNKNRRIGCSISGITQAFSKFGRRATLQAMSKGYERIQSWDKTYSDWLGIPKSIKTTSIKPSGTVSLLSGVTPGIHYPISEYYVRNIRFQKGNETLKVLSEAGYPVEKDKYSDNTYVVSFPIKQEYYDRSASEVSMWEQLENAAQVQEHWADNQVSVTITFQPHEAKDISKALELYETRLKGVSFLPSSDHGYEQAPYVPITEAEYLVLSNEVKPYLGPIKKDQTDSFCDGLVCEVKL